MPMVWGLKVVSVTDNFAAAVAGFQVGEVIIDVARFASFSDAPGDQSKMTELFATARGGDG